LRTTLPTNPPNPPTLAAIIHPTHHTHTYHLLSNIWKENRGGGFPWVLSLYFLLCFPGTTMPWRIYIFTSPGASSVQTFFLYHPIVAFYLSLLFLFSMVARVEREYLTGQPYVTLHTYTVCLFRSVTPLRSAIPLHAYHSLSVWPLYQQPLPFARLSSCSLRQVAPIAM